MAATTEKETFVQRIYDSVSSIKKKPQTECDRCFERYQFTRLPRFSKKTCLPPVGSDEKGQILFIGTNPRCNAVKGDDAFYRHALSNKDQFLQFSEDGKFTDSNGNNRFLFDDTHYDIHKECLARVDSSWKLGRRSSVAELFMCGSEDANIFYRDKNNNLYKKYDLARYTCAEEFLKHYIELVQPKIIVSIGWPSMQWIQTRFKEDLENTTKSLFKGNPREYKGNPATDKITELHGCFSEISLNRIRMALLFALHPNSRGFDSRRHEELIDSFDFLATKAGF